MRRRTQSHLVLVSVLFWVLVAGGFLLYGAQERAAVETAGTTVGQLTAQHYMENALPVISRGTGRVAERDLAADAETNQGVNQEEAPSTDAPKALKGLMTGSFPFLTAAAEQSQKYTKKVKAENEKQQLAAAKAVEEAEKKAAEAAALENEQKKKQVQIVDTAEGKKPLVLIVHTHATESYQPVSAGNFHSIEEKGTVREVGNELTKALEAKGIPVIHDKTLHDNPSYNQSYGRSLKTVQNYLDKNPSIKIVIDLHRDAASYSGNVGKIVNVNGNQAATYSLVIGKGNANVDKLQLFANRINVQANRLYPGLAGRIIEKEYRFNEYLSDQYMLLEMGNNENNIDQVKLTGKYFADILEAYIKEYPQ